jgi:hypothetical protein
LVACANRAKRPSLTGFLPASAPTVPLRRPQILESSQTLLNVLKRETVNLTKKRQASN